MSELTGDLVDDLDNITQDIYSEIMKNKSINCDTVKEILWSLVNFSNDPLLIIKLQEENKKLKECIKGSCDYDESWMWDGENLLVEKSDPEYQRYKSLKECLGDLDSCVHPPRVVCNKCEKKDEPRNNPDEMENCSYPDCGCPEARLCMAKNGPNNSCYILNRERE